VASRVTNRSASRDLPDRAPPTINDNLGKGRPGAEKLEWSMGSGDPITGSIRN
jgi:hypothetical protein